MCVGESFCFFHNYIERTDNFCYLLLQKLIVIYLQRIARFTFLGETSRTASVEIVFVLYKRVRALDLINLKGHRIRNTSDLN